MSPLTRNRKDASGVALRPDAVYQCISPYTTGYHGFNYDSRLRGDSDAVLTHPTFWAPEGLDPEELARLRAIASTPTYVDHSTPQPPPIPPERQAVAAESFMAKDGTFVQSGQIFRDDHPAVKAHRSYFRRPAQPLEAA